MSEAADVPFIDCHHHIWDPTGSSHPWLTNSPPIAFRYGDYSAICRPYLPADYDRDAEGQFVAGHVTMEGEWDEADPVGETRWLAQVFAAHPTYLGHVARAFLDRDDVAEVLAGHAAFDFVKGIRHKPVAGAGPDDVEAGRRGSMSDPDWHRGYKMLADHGLHFELQAPWWHARELLDLIATAPEIPVVINHAFLPSDRGAEALAAWREALRLAASAPNTFLKISGMGLADKRWRADENRPVVDGCLEVFGAARCLIASNFPVDRLCGSFGTIIGGYKNLTSGLSQAERRQLFHDNAVRVYRLDVALSS